MAPEKRRLVTRLLRGTVRHVLRITLYGVVGAVLTLIAVFVIVLERRPDLEVWHTEHLDAEFTVDSPIATFEEYLALENRLFAQLDDLVYAHVPTGDARACNRYRRGSIADPARWPTNWNRSFELSATEPKVGVLLLHGMSDSPYSMRSMANRLHAEGATVLAIRIPGHGAAPSGLLHVEWEDMAAAVQLAMRHLRSESGDTPLYIVGYSNGGALAVEYALSTLTDDTLPTVRGLVLLSPQIGISKLAALAAWQERLGHVLGLEKLAWNSILVEYDPFKYGSFALNAGKQAYRVTSHIQERITALTQSGDLEDFPPLLAFQSAVDATVLAPVLVQGLFERVPGDDHELVVFDINRVAAMEHLLKTDPGEAIERLLARPNLSFAMSLVTNESGESRNVVVRRRVAGDATISVTPLDLAWPDDLYSLAHIALPFPPDDPLYGGPDATGSPGIQIGNLVARGERGVLQISATEMLRLHWNPFYPYIEQRMVEFMGLSDAPSSEAP